MFICSCISVVYEETDTRPAACKTLLMGNETGHSDDKLFRKLISDPERALEAIYERHGESVIRYLRKIKRLDDDTIKDIVHDTFIILWEKRDTAAYLEAPLFWLLKVAKNKAMDELRRVAKMPAGAISYANELPAAERADRVLEQQEIGESYQRAAGGLTPHEQEVCKGVLIHEKSNKELAKENGVTVQTIKNSLSKGLKKLRKALKALRSVCM